MSVNLDMKFFTCEYGHTYGVPAHSNTDYSGCPFCLYNDMNKIEDELYDARCEIDELDHKILSLNRTIIKYKNKITKIQE